MKKDEHITQSRCVQWYRANYKDGVMFAVPNAQVRNYATLMYQKAEGLLVGAPDTVVVLPNGKVAFVEFKTKTGKQSEQQVAIEEVMNRANKDLYWVCRSFEEFVDIIKHLTEDDIN